MARRNRPATLRSALATALAAAALPAAAECTWDWLCNGDGACKLMPVCDSVYDVPPPPPADATPPAVPPLAMRPHRIAGPMGPLSCEHIMRKGKNGRWHWHEACFCTDRTKAPDPSTPFAHIVRCDDK